MANIPMRLIETPDCAKCDKSNCTDDCMSFQYGQSVKLCPHCKSHSIVNNEDTYKFCPECGQAIKLGEGTIHLNPQTVVTYDEDWVPNYEFGGYDISQEDMEELKRRYGNGK